MNWNIQDLHQFGPIVVIVALFLGFMWKVVAVFISAMEIRDKIASERDQKNNDTTAKFIEVVTKISEYMPRLVTALEEYNRHFPLIYQKNMELTQENARLNRKHKDKQN